MPRITRDAAEAVAYLRRARRILITSHASPDGDAVGSALAVGELARALAIDSLIVQRDPHPASLGFLPGIEKVEVVAEIAPAELATRDLAVVLECPGLSRPGLMGLERLPILNIDHHLENERYGELNYLDEEAPAVGEMVLRMAEAAGVALSPAMATCLYTALVTDTGDFRYSNATPRAFDAASRLVAGGARPHLIADALWNQTPARVVRLTAEVLATLELHAGGRLALIICDLGMLARAGARPEDTENLINIPRTIAGVEVAMLLKAFTPGVTRASLRSRGAVDVQRVAAQFGGGGHRNAAGCTVPAPLEEARRALLDHLLPLLELQ
jgi:phosphoesterase RecJ-like protein